MSKGKVWLVGAGPYNRGLITVRGKEIIENSDVVIYDNLVGQEIINMIPQKAEKINAGKRAGKHTIRQEEINNIIYNKAVEGKKVVRLKGGDPFLFGRGGEELELLYENNIEFEIVPGVTSAISVPAYCGIPVTHRNYSSSVHIITAHKKEDVESNINFKALSELNGTLIFLMGVSCIENIVIGLINSGMDLNTPIGVIEKGTSSKQKKIISTLKNIIHNVRKIKLNTPAIIIVGQVCLLSYKFNWFEKQKLGGCKVCITRPKDSVSVLSEKLRNLGAEILEIPSIETVEIEDNSFIIKCLNEIENYNWIVFTSPKGVKIFFEKLRRNKIDIRKLNNIKIACIGEATNQEIENIGMFSHLVSQKYNSEDFSKLLLKEINLNDKVLIARSKIGNENIINYLKQKNIYYDDVSIYDTVFKNSNDFIHFNDFKSENVDFVIFTSKSTVKGFVNAVKLDSYEFINALCIGEQTKNKADEYKMKTFISDEATIDSLVKTVTDLYCKNKQER